VHHHLTFSIITRYEILRGLHAKKATTQLAVFDRLCSVSTILPLTDAIVVRAATVYADLYQRGTLIGDADILIASTGLEYGLIVVTNNESHYQRIAGIQLENWLA
jgi:tRNA(fMet)-specific endonuclease VapC